MPGALGPGHGRRRRRGIHTHHLHGDIAGVDLHGKRVQRLLPQGCVARQIQQYHRKARAIVAVRRHVVLGQALLRRCQLARRQPGTHRRWITLGHHAQTAQLNRPALAHPLAAQVGMAPIHLLIQRSKALTFTTEHMIVAVTAPLTRTHLGSNLRHVHQGVARSQTKQQIPVLKGCQPSIELPHTLQ